MLFVTLKKHQGRYHVCFICVRQSDDEELTWSKLSCSRDFHAQCPEWCLRKDETLIPIEQYSHVWLLALRHQYSEQDQPAWKTDHYFVHHLHSIYKGQTVKLRAPLTHMLYSNHFTTIHCHQLTINYKKWKYFAHKNEDRAHFFCPFFQYSCHLEFTAVSFHVI